PPPPGERTKFEGRRYSRRAPLKVRVLTAW
ncbi:MAG: hypothetical protein QOK35_1446, partial [Pseudonocardiales bacterium]|nr:hypothetical protein [Pseudonocardiales bacterium]